MSSDQLTLGGEPLDATPPECEYLTVCSDEATHVVTYAYISDEVLACDDCTDEALEDVDRDRVRELAPAERLGVDKNGCQL